MPFTTTRNPQSLAGDANRKAWLPTSELLTSLSDDTEGDNSDKDVEAQQQRQQQKASHDTNNGSPNQKRRSRASGSGHGAGAHEKQGNRLTELASDIFQGARTRLISSSRLIMTRQQESDKKENGGAKRKPESSTAAAEPQNSKDNSNLEAGSHVLRRWIRVTIILVLLNLIVLHWPIDGPSIEPKIMPFRPRPLFEGPLKENQELDLRGELLFAGQFHAPESFAWRRDKRAFYTGVEGGFIIMIEPYEERWTVVARLNSRSVLDKSGKSGARLAPFCTKDVELYGPRAEFEPHLVIYSRCSRPLGIRLSPDDSYLYVSDTLSGLYRIDLKDKSENNNNSNNILRRPQVSKLTDFTKGREIGQEPTHESETDVMLADDIAVGWGHGSDNSDLIYLTDCSRKWTVRYLFRLMLENDNSGRVLEFDVGKRRLRPLELNLLQTETQKQLGANQNQKHNESLVRPEAAFRNLSFPNGLEITANGSALLISDLNNRRILMHHLRGPLAGQTEFLLWVPGYSDNIRRGLDLADGRPSYWTACGCAVGDGWFEMAEFFNDYPRIKKLLLKWLNFWGVAVESLGSLMGSTSFVDAGAMIRAGWLKVDPYCGHGIVLQFDERGQIIRSLQAPSRISPFKLLSEAHEVPLLTDLEEAPSAGGRQQQAANRSLLFLGSVYYSYLGRVELMGENGS